MIWLVYEGKLLTQKVNDYIKTMSLGDRETRKKPAYQARTALDEVQKRGGKLKLYCKKTRGSKSYTLRTKGEKKTSQRGHIYPHTEGPVKKMSYTSPTR